MLPWINRSWLSCWSSFVQDLSLSAGVHHIFMVRRSDKIHILHILDIFYTITMKYFFFWFLSIFFQKQNVCDCVTKIKSHPHVTWQENYPLQEKTLQGCSSSSKDFETAKPIKKKQILKLMSCWFAAGRSTWSHGDESKWRVTEAW